MLSGLSTLQPNEAAIVQLFGAYRGTTRTPGLRATNPFYTRKKLSLRALAAELEARFEKAGVIVEEARITHLAYAPEIAQVMLRRQAGDYTGTLYA